MTTKRLESQLEELNETAFEEWLCVFLQERFGLPTPPQRHGLSGYGQQGVDVYTRLESGDLIGVQAKAYVQTKLTPAMMDKELALAHDFNPPLQKYIICTLNRRNPRLQEHARLATIHGRHEVTVLALQDLAEETANLPRAMRDLIRRTTSADVYIAMRQVFDDQAGQALAPMGPEAALPLDPKLRKIEGWLEAGQPQRALDELAAHSGPVERVARRRIETRAWFALGHLDAVVELARAEQHEGAPDAVLLASGGHAAQLLGDSTLTDGLLTLALAQATDAERPEVAAAFLRAHAHRGDKDIAALEQFACETVGDPETLALALADSAFQLGAIDEAVHWYQRARECRPVWPLGAEVNELGARSWQLIHGVVDGDPSQGQKLREFLPQLENLVARTQSLAAGLRTPVLINLGHVYRVLQNYVRAASVWDEALGLPDVDASLWLQRCVLSANEQVPLPSEALADHWATTPISRLALASACTMQHELARADALIESVLSEETLSDDEFALARIERIRLDCNGSDDKVTYEHVAEMLELYALGNRSTPLFAWLVFNYPGATVDQTERARKAVNELASVVVLEPVKRFVLIEDLLRAELDETALSWLQAVETVALDSEGRVTSVRAARVLLRLYVRAFRFMEARALVSQLSARWPDDAAIALEGGHALEQAGDRLGAYQLLSAAVQHGQRDSTLVLSWARIAVVVKRRREANRLMQKLDLTPRGAEDYSQILQARAWLGVSGQDQYLVAGGAPITPATAGAVFGAGLIGRPSRHSAVRYGRVVHVRIGLRDRVKLDERILLAESPDFKLSGVRTHTPTEYPWVRELLNARVGDVRILTVEPFEGHTATIVDVVEADRWSVLEARTLVQRLPAAMTGIKAIEGDLDTLLGGLRQQVLANQVIQQGVLQRAEQKAMSIALTAAALRITPRALLSESPGWRPAGHSGTPEDIARDDAALASGGRLVLDPVTVLLIVELDAEAFVEAMGEKPVMTPQAVQQLFDWWYSFERYPRGGSGRVGVTDRAVVAFAPHSAADRRTVGLFWQRVKRLVTKHIETLDPPPMTRPEIQRVATVLGPAISSGMALAQDRGWVYITEEPLLRALATGTFCGHVASLHRLLVRGTTEGLLTPAHAVVCLAAMIRRGWRWVSFPVSMLGIALQLPESARWPTISALLSRARSAEASIALGALFELLRAIDSGRFPGVNSLRVRELVGKSFPQNLTQRSRVALAAQFGAAHPDRQHRASRKLLRRWARDG